MRPWLVAVLVLMSLRGWGQSMVWEKKLGWTNSDVLNDIIKTPNGDFLAFGTSKAFGVRIGSTIYPQVCFYSFNELGDSLWFKTIGLYGGGISAPCPDDSEGFYAIAGSSFPMAPYGALFRFNYQGDTLWKIMLPPAVSAGRTIKARNGDLITIGRISYQVGTDWWTDLCILCFDPQLRLVKWVKQYNNNHPRSVGNWIEQTDRGTFLASGTAGSRIWAIEVDSVGEEIARQTFYQTPTHAELDGWSRVQQAPGGAFIVSGGPVSYTPNFSILGRYSSFSSANRVWGGERYNAFALPPHIQDDGSLAVYNGGQGSWFVTKINSDSGIVWNQQLTSHLGSTPPAIYSFSYQSDSSVIAVGTVYTDTPVREDFYLCRIRGVGVPYDPTQPVAAKPIYKGLPPLIAYPNPTAGRLTVHTRSRAGLAVYSLSGKKLLEVLPDPSGTSTVDMSGLPRGMYILRQGAYSTKILKD